MEIRPGYKPTDVGVIPVEWEVTPLSELVTEFRGGAPLKPSDFTTTGVKVLPKGGVGRTGWLQVEANDFQHCSPRYAAAHRNNQVDQSYTIVVLRDLVPSGPSIGLIVQIKEAETYVLAQGVYGFKVNERAEPRYLIQLSNTRWYRQMMNSIMVGSTQVHITNTAFKRAKIPLPKPPEQRAIATALSDVDGLLSVLDRLIAKKRDLKQAAMQQLLTGQTRLPGFHGEWEVKRLDQLGGCFAGGTPSTARSDYWGGDVLWLPSGRVQNNILARPTDSEITITRKGLAESAAKSIKPHSVLVAITGATCANVALLQFEAAANQSVVAIEPFDDTNANFLYYSLLMERGQILSRQSGSAQGGINLKTVKGLTIRCPLLPEQTAIASVLTEMDGELAVLEQRREKTRALKQAMMQELLTGRTRLV